MTINTQKLRAFRQSLKRCASNTGHGHVYMRPDGFLAKCGGPGICTECAKDLALLMSTEGYEPPTTDDLIDTIDAQAAEIARLRGGLAGLIGVCEPNIYPQPDKPNSPWAALQTARAVLREPGHDR